MQGPVLLGARQIEREPHEVLVRLGAPAGVFALGHHSLREEVWVEEAPIVVVVRLPPSLGQLGDRRLLLVARQMHASCCVAGALAVVWLGFDVPSDDRARVSALARLARPRLRDRRAGPIGGLGPPLGRLMEVVLVGKLRGRPIRHLQHTLHLRERRLHLDLLGQALREGLTAVAPWHTLLLMKPLAMDEGAMFQEVVDVLAGLGWG
eukprot:scaffold18487_cov143-Isochrysis_galbana.AAC.2